MKDHYFVCMSNQGQATKGSWMLRWRLCWVTRGDRQPSPKGNQWRAVSKALLPQGGGTEGLFCKETRARSSPVFTEYGADNWKLNVTSSLSSSPTRCRQPIRCSSFNEAAEGKTILFLWFCRSILFGWFCWVLLNSGQQKSKRPPAFHRGPAPELLSIDAGPARPTPRRALPL